MKTLIALLSTGKGSWKEIYNLINTEEWDKIFLVTNEFGKEKFENKNAEFILCDFNDPIDKIRNKIIEGLKNKIPDTEVAISIISGSGKEHTALLSAILKSGLGPRLIYYEEGLKEA